MLGRPTVAELSKKTTVDCGRGKVEGSKLGEGKNLLSCQSIKKQVQQSSSMEAGSVSHLSLKTLKC